MDTHLATDLDEDRHMVEYDWDEDAATFGDRLALARESQHLDQGELARRLGVRSATIRNWETDRSEPRANRLQMLAGLLNVSIVWLMTGQGEGAPEAHQNGAAETGDVRGIVDEMRAVRVAQQQLADRLSLLEKRLRSAVLTG